MNPDEKCRAILREDPLDKMGDRCNEYSYGPYISLYCPTIDRTCAQVDKKQEVRDPIKEYFRSALSELRFCDDIFDDDFKSAMSDVVKQIPHMAEKCKGWSGPCDVFEAGIFATLEWIRSFNYCSAEYMFPAGTVHGEYKDKTRDIVIYSTACRAGGVYGASLEGFTVDHTFLLVAAHEMGHAIDQITGDLYRNPLKVWREDRATVYGTYLAQCLATINREFIITVEEPEYLGFETAEQLECADMRWSRIESSIAAVRQLASLKELRAPPLHGRATVSKSLWSGLACMELNQ